MNRRTFLGSIAGLSTTGLAGCQSSTTSETDERTETDQNQEPSGPAETVEQFHLTVEEANQRQNTLTHSLDTGGNYELVSVETQTLEENLDVEEIAERTGFAENTLEPVVYEEQTALIESTVVIDEFGDRTENKEEAVLVTEDGDWRILDRERNHADEVQPNSALEFDYEQSESESNTLTITLTEGDSIGADDLYLRGTIDEHGLDQPVTSDGLFSELPERYAISGIGGFDTSSDELQAGQGIEITADSEPLESYDLDIVWDTGENSATLATDRS
jgi:hypothetical protein